jgi:hypothetical protein
MLSQATQAFDAVENGRIVLIKNRQNWREMKNPLQGVGAGSSNDARSIRG